MRNFPGIECGGGDAEEVGQGTIAGAEDRDDRGIRMHDEACGVQGLDPCCSAFDRLVKADVRACFAAEVLDCGALREFVPEHDDLKTARWIVQALDGVESAGELLRRLRAEGDVDGNEGRLGGKSDVAVAGAAAGGDE